MSLNEESSSVPLNSDVPSSPDAVEDVFATPFGDFTMNDFSIEADDELDDDKSMDWSGFKTDAFAEFVDITTSPLAASMDKAAEFPTDPFFSVAEKASLDLQSKAGLGDISEQIHTREDFDEQFHELLLSPEQVDASMEELDELPDKTSKTTEFEQLPLKTTDPGDFSDSTAELESILDEDEESVRNNEAPQADILLGFPASNGASNPSIPSDTNNCLPTDIDIVDAILVPDVSRNNSSDQELPGDMMSAFGTTQDEAALEILDNETTGTDGRPPFTLSENNVPSPPFQKQSSTSGSGLVGTISDNFEVSMRTEATFLQDLLGTDKVGEPGPELAPASIEENQTEAPRLELDQPLLENMGRSELAAFIPQFTEDGIPIETISTEPSVGNIENNSRVSVSVESALQATVPELHPCKGCREVFLTNEELKRHRRRKHPNAKIMKCEYCPMKFSLKCNKMKHIRTVHRNERNFPCTEPGCHKKFAERNKMKKHILSVHQCIKNFQCDDPRCGGRFGQKSDLTRHIAIIHLNVKRFKCGSCEQTDSGKSRFGRRSSLAQHLARVHSMSSEEVQQCFEEGEYYTLEHYKYTRVFPSRPSKKGITKTRTPKSRRRSSLAQAEDAN